MPLDADGEFKRGNGFERPFDKLQVLAWVITLYLILSFFLLAVPLQDTVMKMWCATVYCLLFAGFALLAVRSGAVDPVDQTVRTRPTQRAT